MYIKKLAREVKTGAGGFEPTNGGTKNRSLATWRRPIIILTINEILI